MPVPLVCSRTHKEHSHGTNHLKEAADQLLLGLCMGLTSGLAEIEFQAAEEEEQLEREWQLRERFLQAQTDYYDNLEEETPKRAA